MSDYFKQGKYLPKWFRDFHIQKLFFRMMHKRKSKGNQKYIDKFIFDLNEPISWMRGHIYVIDDFLWFMAKCGYTLQKDRKLSKDPNCYNVQAELDKFQDEELKEVSQIILKKEETN